MRAMPRPRFRDHRRHFERLIAAALMAVDPYQAVTRALMVEGHQLTIGDFQFGLAPDSRIWIVAFGKASAPMSRAASDVLKGFQTRGVLVVPEGTEIEVPPRLEVHHGGHPLPTDGSICAGEAVAHLLGNTQPHDLTLALISGGGSAMLELPVAGVSLCDLRWLNDRLLASGAPIETINRIRKAYSQIKGGGLLHLAAPARVAALILSDVIGDDPAAIASGPTVPHEDLAKQARAALRALGLWKELPRALQEALDRPRIDRPGLPPLGHTIIGSNRTALAAVQAEAKRLGFHVWTDDQPIEGEARDAGARIARELRAHAESVMQPVCILYGGETTVTLDSHGRGGRNQELALSAALGLSGLEGVALMAFATDGIDGPTDAAGAIVTGMSAPQMIAKGRDPNEHLRRHEAYPALAAIDALIRTGPTSTNVNDIIAVLLFPPNGVLPESQDRQV